ncbi:hypothetical protein LguiA_017949 [Lonicera macranthoides]
MGSTINTGHEFGSSSESLAYSTLLLMHFSAYNAKEYGKTDAKEQLEGETPVIPAIPGVGKFLSTSKDVTAQKHNVDQDFCKWLEEIAEVGGACAHPRHTECKYTIGGGGVADGGGGGGDGDGGTVKGGDPLKFDSALGEIVLCNNDSSYVKTCLGPHIYSLQTHMAVGDD